jgi:GTP pyrophosphokinase
MPTQLTDRFQNALAYAATLHGKQTRKASGEPYLSHLLAVAALVMENGGNEDECIAALLHDAAEDQGGRPILKEIQERFGAKVATIVEGCSDTFETPKPAWRVRKETHITHLQTESPSVRLITAADKLHNIRSILREYRRQGETLWSCFHGGRDGTLWYYRAVVTVLRQTGNSLLIEELERAVDELESLASRSARVSQ